MSTPVATPPPPPPPSPPPRRKIGKWIALGCVGLALAVAAFVAILYFGLRASTAGPEQAVQGFLKAAGAGDYPAAYAYFSAPLQQSQTLAEFSAAAHENSIFFQVEETTFNQRHADTSGVELSGTVRLATGTEVPASFKLVKENGAWKLIGYQIGS
ncbi:MAG TPA: hypothetical protein VFE44_00610 [Thermoanaerobaculia bacterium]|nr:hypothetical protein [Thermoanaerobaculia bacterium]